MKLMLILEAEDIDILCLQETWVATGAAAPILEGFYLVEQRRPNGTRGGLATYIRKPLKVETSSGNEYCLQTKIILPNSQRINIVNIYIPPMTSLTKRNILETHATTQVETVLDNIQP